MEDKYHLLNQMELCTLTEKADILNGQFQKAFSEKTNISNEEFQIQCKMTGTFNTIKDINITENGVQAPEKPKSKQGSRTR
jgi:hypothetical protein